MDNTDHEFSSGWNQLEIKFSETANDIQINVYDLSQTGSNSVMSLTVPGLNWAYDEDAQFHFGSFLGLSEATEGRMYDLVIADSH